MKCPETVDHYIHYWKQNQVDLLIPRNGLFPDINTLEIVDPAHPT